MQRDDRDRKARLCQLRMGKFDELQRSLGRGYERSLSCPQMDLQQERGLDMWEFTKRSG